MIKRILIVLSALTILLVCTSWGFFAHYRINRLAVFTLPRAMKPFYLTNIEFITAHAVSADKRRYVDSLEAPRHYFNADHYGKNPFSRMPQKWKDAAKKYSEDTLKKYGTVPWEIQYQYYKLVDAFKRHDTTAILTTSANLGHYVADAHVPLHLTRNYNGQLTNQTGLHAFWESRLPELFAAHYHLNIGKARYIDNPLTEAFKICRASFKGVDSVIVFERRLNAAFPSSQKYESVRRGGKTVQEYAVTYSKAYHRMLNGMVERRMRSAILSIGSYWYSAWVDAGQPDLNKLIVKPLSLSDKTKIQREEMQFSSGKALRK